MFPLKSARMLAALLLALSLMTFSAACGGGDDDEEDIAEEDAAGATETAGVKYAPTGNEGSVTGTIAFAGTAPAPKSISMDQDPVCSSSNPNALAEDLVVKDGKLQNVFVYVKDGKTADGKNITALAFDPPAQPAVLDQKGCHYVPHVLGIQTGQKLSVTNSDQTAHNVNVQANSNPKFNKSQPPAAAPIEQAFNRAETLIPVKCNQHPWMKSYIGVLKHPFFGVSGEDGKFEIKGLPPGTYTLVAWHERYGDKQQQASVTIGQKETKTQDFSFAATTASNTLSGGTLQLMPALELPMLGQH
ncbi:MAG TPA: carboxypeptidase regulatory-like domain-containing protein [Pyrinomonadaceae bacterium]|jgi:plastocyanin